MLLAITHLYDTMTSGQSQRCAVQCERPCWDSSAGERQLVTDSLKNDKTALLPRGKTTEQKRVAIPLNPKDVRTLTKDTWKRAQVLGTKSDV